jgi:N-acetylneuraminate synthase
MSETEIEIAGRRIGPHQPPYIIAEMSCNHLGKLDRAIEIIKAAKDAGADAVKLQTYTADTITIDCDRPDFQVNDDSSLWRGETLHGLYKRAHTPWEWHPTLFAKARELGITVFSSPFDPTAIELLHSLGAPAYKIASFEIVDLPLINAAAKRGKPLIISTGMASLGEISDAVQAAREAGCGQIALLHCTSGYPTPPEQSNLRTIGHLAEAFDVVVGLSDHTRNVAVPIAAVANGACLIEVHLIIDRNEPGPHGKPSDDAPFSLEPLEFASLVSGCRTAWRALGRVNYDLEPSERASRVFRRSLYAVADIPEGGMLTAANVRSIRPGRGLPPKHLPEILGRRAARAIARGTPMSWSLIDPNS